MTRSIAPASSPSTQSRLVIVTSRFLPDLGGVQTHVAETTQRLLALGWQVTIITGVGSDGGIAKQQPWQWQPDASHPSRSATIIPIHYDAIVGVGLLQIWWQVLQTLPVLSKATVIHAHDVLWWLFPARLVLPLARVVLTMHGWEGRFPIPARLKFIKQLGAVLADKVMAIGDYIGHYYGIRPDCVSYGAVSNQILAALPTTHSKSTSHHRLKVAYVGRLAADTGLGEMLAAVPFLTQHEWHFYGDGPLRAACEQWGTVHGWTATKPWLTDADILIGSGYLSVWEALLAGKQVVVYANNQLKVDYFKRAPFAGYIKLTTNRDEFIAACTPPRTAHAEAQALARSNATRALAQDQQWDKIVETYQGWYQEIQAWSWWQLFTRRWQHLRLTKQDLLQGFGRFLLTYLVSMFGLVMISGVCLWLGIAGSGQLTSRQQLLATANQTATVASVLTAHQLMPIELLKKSSSTLLGITQLADQVTQVDTTHQPNQPAVADILTRVLADGARVAETACNQSSRLPLSKQQLSSLQETCQVLPHTQSEWSALQSIVQAIFNEHLELLVVMQNTQELRATGGFMGSYARIQFGKQLLPDYEIGDIYEPDGQFQGYIAAPAGVDEYLSSGKGLRLPDANWFPDFPTSAQTILKYFAYGKRQGVDGVVAINLPVFEQILAVLGPVSIPDYDLVVTADNFAQVARADRKNFFPGSQQKPHFLTALANQVRFRFEAAPAAEKLACLRILFQALQQQDIQFYLINEQLQSKIDTLGWSGRQQLPDTLQAKQPLYFMSVESNVGINKANRAIQRQLLLDLSERSLLVQLKLKNQNSLDSIQGTPQEIANGMGYVDYQRIYVSPFFVVKQIVIDGVALPSWHEQLIQTDADTTLNQIGFVVPVPVGEERTALIKLELDPSQSQVTHTNQLDAVFIQKQAGLPAVEYAIQTPDQVMTHTVSRHTLIQLKK